MKEKMGWSKGKVPYRHFVPLPALHQGVLLHCGVHIVKSGPGPCVGLVAAYPVFCFVQSGRLSYFARVVLNGVFIQRSTSFDASVCIQQPFGRVAVICSQRRLDIRTNAASQQHMVYNNRGVLFHYVSSLLVRYPERFVP